MNESFSTFNEGNPFSTRFTAPGKTPFFFERSFLHRIKNSKTEKFQTFFARALGMGEDLRASICLQYLVDQFETHSCRGQIVGGRGAGKTTLMCAIKERLLREGYEIFSWSLSDQNRFLPDVFWYELQQFLQTVPVFLPNKCLLPPPVMSREEYLRQQREAMNSVFGDPQEGKTPEEKKDDDEIGEFRVSDEALARANADAAAEAPENENAPKCDPPPNEISESKTTEEIGLMKFEREESKPVEPGLQDAMQPIKFAPFHGLEPREADDATPTSDGSSDAPVEPEEELDELEIVESESEPASAAADDDPIELLATPIDFKKRRSLFEKKALFFDGFDHLTYVNRIILRTFCRMNHLGLLIATRTPAIGLPVLFRTIPSVEVLDQLLKFLLEDFDSEMEGGMEVSETELETLLKNFHYDVREILFSLYDAYETYRRAPRDLREKILRDFPR